MMTNGSDNWIATLELMGQLWPNWKPHETELTEWREELQRLNQDTVRKALARHKATSRFKPTVPEVKSLFYELVGSSGEDKAAQARAAEEARRRKQAAEDREAQASMDAMRAEIRSDLQAALAIRDRLLELKYPGSERKKNRTDDPQRWSNWWMSRVHFQLTGGPEPPPMKGGIVSVPDDKPKGWKQQLQELAKGASE